MRRKHERECLKAKNEIYQEIQTAHKKELDAQDELICLQKELDQKFGETCGTSEVD